MSESKHILVAEDNPALAAVIRFNLQRAGHRVTVVKNGRDAYQQIISETPDLVITDQQMPIMTGVELCRHLRTLDCGRNLPVIMLTAKALELDSQQLLQDLGVLQVFPKPFSPSAIVAAVEQTLTEAQV